MYSVNLYINTHSWRTNGIHNVCPLVMIMVKMMLIDDDCVNMKIMMAINDDSDDNGDDDE